MTRRPGSLVAAAASCALVLAACGGSGSDPTPKPTPKPESHHSTAEAPESAPLRKGEKFLDLTMPEPYTPKAPAAPGTDDYRCFLLDPQLDEASFVTGLDVVPGNLDVVHHVILFKIGPGAVAEAKTQDAEVEGQGWTCFGGAGVGLDPSSGFDQAPWLGAWAPGTGESILAPDIGVPLEAGSRIVMQVHYNLRAGHQPDVSSARLRVAPGTADIEPLRTMLLAGPVELPCRPGKTEPLCDRDAAVRDVSKRFGGQAGMGVLGLQLMCGGNPNNPKASPRQSCDRTVGRAGTIRAVAGHMHLLGRSISISLHPGTARERKVLDISVWDFDNQKASPLSKPAKVKPGDVLRLTCRHDQALRDSLPELRGTPERYVVWGEGTTDEMCLGIAMLTDP